MKTRFLVALGFLASIVSTVSHAATGKVYIYFGPGSCEVQPQPDGSVRNDECSSAFVEIAKRAGLQPVAIRPSALHRTSSAQEIAHFFDDVKVWIQPAGASEEVLQAMSPEMIRAVKAFVANGGGYVGTGAGGALLAAPMPGKPGFKFFPGRSEAYESVEATPGLFKKTPDYSSSLEKIEWAGITRRVFFADDPYFVLMTPEELKRHPEFSAPVVVARYPDGKIAAARSYFGKGRVFIAGVTPEAPAWWTKDDGLVDADGVDHHLVEAMIRWAAQ